MKKKCKYPNNKKVRFSMLDQTVFSLISEKIIYCVLATSNLFYDCRFYVKEKDNY